MEIIRSFFNHNLNIKSYFNENICFMDIETTGFSREKDILYLIGIMYYEDDRWILDQYFLNDLNKEKDLITKAVEFMNSFDLIINYNGNTFDFPFINTRSLNLGLSIKADREKSFDIYRLVKENKNFLKLSNLKLKTIEESLGYFREDKYTGLDCINFFKDYIVSKNEESKTLVLKHNNDDLFHMLDIIKIIDIIDAKKTICLNLFKKKYRLVLDTYSFTGDNLVMNYRSNKDFDMDLKLYNNDYNITSTNKSYLTLEIPLKKAYFEEKKLILFLSLKDFPIKNLAKNHYPELGLPNLIYPLKIASSTMELNLIEISKLILNNLSF